MKIAKIKLNDIANGEGICLSLWTQGCNHFCKGCFNQETWDYSKGNDFTSQDFNYIIDNIDKNNIKRDLSILGGDPLYEKNLEGMYNFLKNFRKIYPNKKIYLWTGYLFEDIMNNKDMKQVVELVDVLIDGEFEESKKNISLKFRGSDNQRVIDIKQSLKENKVILYKY